MFLKSLSIAIMCISFSVTICIQVCYANVTERIVTIQAKPEPIEVDLKKTALVVVDMQNAYASKGGIFDRVGQDISGTKIVIDNNYKIVSAARSAGIKIIYLKMKIVPDLTDNAGLDSPSMHKGIGLTKMARKPKFKGKFMAQNPWNEEIVEELKPQIGDIVIEKKRYSGFGGTNLDQILKNSNIKYLVITGIATNSCVESTLRDAYDLDYWPILVADATNNAGPSFTQQATLWNVEVFLGWVTTTSDILKVLSAK